MADIHLSTIENLIACRDQLAFTLMDQFPPPLDIANPLWEAYRLLVDHIETIKAENGYVEQGLTLFAPKPE